MIKLQKVSKKYRLGENEINALIEIDLDINSGERVCLMGPSGSGKSTLMNIIGAIDTPDKGEVYINNENITHYNDSKIADFRLNNIGYIFQNFNLFDVLNVFENIEYPLILKKVPKARRKKIVQELMDATEIAHLNTHKPMQLSGGQRQRVAIARALVTRPKLLLADEPTASLDHKTGTKILELIKELNQKYNTTVLYTSHDPLVSKYADKVINMLDGRMVAK